MGLLQKTKISFNETNTEKPGYWLGFQFNFFFLNTVMLYNSDPDNRAVEDEQLSVGEAEMSLLKYFSAYHSDYYY